MIYGEWNGTDDSRSMSSWSLTGEVIGGQLDLPYGVTIGMSAKEARSRIPGHTESEGVPLNNGNILAKSSLQWMLDESNSRVTQIHDNYIFCP